ncbi:MAG TPA: hypothetical protein VJZ76_23235 [Thermoanaerobaculia bacterium]|nr:hypothetical protein [Thermoanaerobaculia bacterium]
MVFDTHSVTVTGVTPGTDVYLYSVSREGMGYYNSIVTREEILHDSAKAGRVDYPLKTPLAARSIWFAVDLSSGLAVAGSPPGYPARQVSLDEHQLKKDANGEVAKLSFDGAVVEIIVVRPGEGIWGGPVGLHAKNDENIDDHANHKAPLISTANLEARAGTKTPAPPKLKNGDVVFMMNSWSTQYAVAVMGGGK